MNLNDLSINLKEKVGKGYKEFWHFKGRYRVVKGGRGSKKSVTTCLWYVINLMKYPLANLLVIRKVFNTHKDSTYSQLKWAVNYLGVSDYWHFSKSPLEVIFKPTGQKILFRGLDNPFSITSITVETGFLCWAWIEEAYQVNNEDDFNKVDLSLRGAMPKGYFKQLTITFNPWSNKHWIKKRFFDVEDSNILAMTTNYKVNEFLSEDDIKLFEDMREKFPSRYKVEGLGEWGVSEGLVYENFNVCDFDIKELVKDEKAKTVFGLDFGYTNDETAFIAALIIDKSLYIFDEHYKKGMSNDDIATMIMRKGFSKEVIIADSSEPKSIDDIRRKGIRRIFPAKKGKDSVLNGISNLQTYTIYILPKCVNTIYEFNNYMWDKKEGIAINKPVDLNNHLMDALRYAMESIKKNKGISIMK